MLTEDNRLFAYGCNADDQLGLEGNQNRAVLTEVKVISKKSSQLIAGSEFTFVLTNKGLCAI